MKDEIILQSRYKDSNNRLIKINDNPLQYKLKTEYHYREGFNDSDTKEYEFIDPEGGPFIIPGNIIEGMTVKRILEGGIIEFES